MIYGYARVSSNGQDLAQQLAQLDAAGCTKIYREKVSAATAERPQLKRAIGALDVGDVLMVTATDRLARNTRDLLNILHAVKEAGAGFRSIAEPMVDTTSQFAEVVIAVLGIAASYERQRITERTAAGRVQAKGSHPLPAGRGATAACSRRHATHRRGVVRRGSGNDIAACQAIAGVTHRVGRTGDRKTLAWIPLVPAQPVSRSLGPVPPGVPRLSGQGGAADRQ